MNNSASSLSSTRLIVAVIGAGIVGAGAAVLAYFGVTVVQLMTSPDRFWGNLQTTSHTPSFGEIYGAPVVALVAFITVAYVTASALMDDKK